MSVEAQLPLDGDPRQLPLDGRASPSPAAPLGFKVNDPFERRSGSGSARRKLAGQ